MSTPELNRLTPTLMAIPAADVSAPSGMPIATFLAEAETLGVLVARPEVARRLGEVGVEQHRLDIYPSAVKAGRQAQSVWTQVRGRQGSDAFKEAVAAGEALRSRMLKACAWNLRRNNKVQATLTLIREGDGVADLAQDLHDLAGLVDNNQAAFVRDQTFDAPAVAAQARDISDALMGGKAEYYLRFTKSEAKDLRDRAFTFLSDLIGELRQAGDYAYEGDPEMTKRFASHYWRNYNRPAVLTTEPTEPAEPTELPDSPDPQDAGKPEDQVTEPV